MTHDKPSLQEMIDFLQDEAQSNIDPMDKYIKCDRSRANMFFAISSHLREDQAAIPSKNWYCSNCAETVALGFRCRICGKLEGEKS